MHAHRFPPAANKVTSPLLSLSPYLWVDCPPQPDFGLASVLVHEPEAWDCVCLCRDVCTCLLGRTVCVTPMHMWHLCICIYVHEDIYTIIQCMHEVHTCVQFCKGTQFRRPLYTWVWFLICMQTCTKINALVHVDIKTILYVWTLWRCLMNNHRWETYIQKSKLQKGINCVGIQVPSTKKDVLCPLVPAGN